MLRTSVATLSTGQSSGSLVRAWVRTSPLWPFFWLGNLIEMELAVSASDRGIGWCCASRKVIFWISTGRVRPGVGVVVASHERSAKKKHTTAMWVSAS